MALIHKRYGPGTPPASDLESPCEAGAIARIMIDRQRKHRTELAQILERNLPTIVVDLVVGPNRKCIQGNPTALGFFSEYFRHTLYDDVHLLNLQLSMPAADAKDVQALVTWTYTGDLETCHPDYRIKPRTPAHGELLHHLWVLGSTLEAPRFSNDAMYHLMLWYHGNPLHVNDVKYTYAHTSEHSILRTFLVDLVLSDPPLNKAKGTVDLDWMAKMGEAHDFVATLLMAGFKRDPIDRPCKPYRADSRRDYMKYQQEEMANSWFHQLAGYDFDREEVINAEHDFLNYPDDFN